MVEIWDATNKIILERELWLAVLQAQKDLGQQIPEIEEVVWQLGTLGD